jgi:hypothetical protein
VGEAWVAYWLAVFKAALRACGGLVACVCQGRTKDYRWSAVPALLMADLHRQGVNLRCPGTCTASGFPATAAPTG